MVIEIMITSFILLNILSSYLRDLSMAQEFLEVARGGGCWTCEGQLLMDTYRYYRESAARKLTHIWLTLALSIPVIGYTLYKLKKS